MSDQAMEVTMRVNGQNVRRTTVARRLLSDFLRHDVGLRGTHVGCEQGVCGCCTVLLNGRSARSCLMLAAQCEGAEIVTVEGLTAKDGSLGVVQQAFHDAHALQCGFCTPGFLITVSALVEEHAGDTLTDDEIRHALAGNLCRCTGYENIIRAVRLALERTSAPASATS